MSAKVDMPNRRRAAYAIGKGISVGSGGYRIVYRSKKPNKWVYKVDRYAPGEYDDRGDNRTEYATYLSIRDNVTLPDGVKIPEMHMVGNVLAAEYVDGKHPSNWCTPNAGVYAHGRDCPGIDKCWATRLNGVRLNDMHAKNVMVTKDGTIYIVDLGHGES